MVTNPNAEQEIKDLKAQIKTLEAQLEQLKGSGTQIEQARIDLEYQKLAFEREKYDDEIWRADDEYQEKLQLKKTTTRNERAKLFLDAQRLSLEREKHKAEMEEKQDIKKSWLTRNIARYATFIGIIIPLLVAVGSLWVSLQTARETSANNLYQKLVEMLMNSNSPVEYKAKAESLAILLPKRIDGTAIANYDPSKYAQPSWDRMKQLMELIAANPGQRKEIVEMYNNVFPDDAVWANKLLPADTMTPTPTKQVNTPIQTTAHQVAASTNTPTPVPTCQIAMPPGFGGSGWTWVGSWEDLAQLLHNHPEILSDAVKNQDEGLRKLLEELSKNPEVLNQLNELAGGKTPNGGTTIPEIHATPFVPQPENPQNPIP